MLSAAQRRHPRWRLFSSAFARLRKSHTLGGVGIDGVAVARLVFWPGKDQVLTLTESGTMARQPNYDFERRERERLKKLKNAERAAAKLKPAAETEGNASDTTESEQ